MANFSIYLPDQLKKQLDKKAKESGESRNQLIRSAVEEYLSDGSVKSINRFAILVLKELNKQTDFREEEEIEVIINHLEKRGSAYRDKLEKG